MIYAGMMQLSKSIEVAVYIVHVIQEILHWFSIRIGCMVDNKSLLDGLYYLRVLKTEN